MFNYGRAAHRNHNHLLGRVEGMDGIKTGYTRASGFNLLTSVKRDGHHIVAVVLGGRTGGIRDRIMADLIETNIDDGSTSRTALAMNEGNAERDDVVAKAEPVRPEPKPEPKLAPMRAEPVREAREPMRLQLARADGAVPQLEPLRYAARRNDGEGAGLNLAVPLAPIPEKPRPAFVSGAPRVVSDDASERPARDRARTALDGSTARPTATGIVAASSTPSAMRWVTGAAPAPQPRPDNLKAAPRPALASSVLGKTTTTIAKAEPAKAQESTRPSNAGWMIQIGATDDAGKANDLLARAKTQGRANLASARPFTEKVQKGKDTLWRARFAGLEENGAEAACKALKRSGFSCFTTKN